MISSLVSLKNLVKTKSYHIDYPVFRLHYQVTVSGLLAFCLILSAKLLFGDTIDCQGTVERDDFIDQTCFSLGTTTKYAVNSGCLNKTAQRTGATTMVLSALVANPNPEHANQLFQSNLQQYLVQNFRKLHRLAKDEESCYSRDVSYIHSGIFPESQATGATTVTYFHSYYRYVPLILFLQAVFFYFPHYLWKIWENGTISSVCKELYENRFSPKEYIDSKYQMIDYLQVCFEINKSLVYKYYFCCVLLMTNLIAQILILNEIFNGHFITYGADFLYYKYIDKNIYGLKPAGTSTREQVNHPLDYVFPKLTSCTLSTYNNAGGSPDDRQFICVLPLNILHDKFFLILWFWLIILAAITFVQMTFDLVYILFPPLRRYNFESKYGRFLPNSWNAPTLTEHFILDLIGQNSDKFAFSTLLKKLNKESDEWNVDSSPSDTASFV